jgi:hypothetical protein
MDCFTKNFKSDNQLCQLCKRLSKIEGSSVYYDCMNDANEKNLEYEKLQFIKSNCPKRSTAWDEYDEFISCDKNENGYGRHADSCKPSLDCIRYNPEFKDFDEVAFDLWFRLK